MSFQILLPRIRKCVWCGLGFLWGVVWILSAAAEMPALGVGTHSPNREALDLLQQTGVESLRDDLYWGEIEKEPGRYDFVSALKWVESARDQELQPLLILGGGNPLYNQGGRPVTASSREAFARYAEASVRRLKGRVRYWEIWNEWNWGTGFSAGTPGGTAQEYVQLLRSVYLRIKAADPQAIVLGGGIAGTDIEWLRQACRRGLLSYCDGVSIHPYCYGAPGEEAWPENGWLERMRRYQSALKDFTGGEGKPIFVTEIGWPNGKDPSVRTVSAEVSARYLARTILLGATLPQLKGIWWYDFRNDGEDPLNREHHFGLVFGDLTPKPSYYALRDVAGFLKRVKSVREEGGVPRGIKLLRFSMKDDSLAFAVWSLAPRQTWRVRWDAERSQAGQPVQLTVVGRGQVRRYWLIDPTKNQSMLIVTADDTPLLLEGNFKMGAIHEICRIQ